MGIEDTAAILVGGEQTQHNRARCSGLHGVVEWKHALPLVLHARTLWMNLQEKLHDFAQIDLRQCGGTHAEVQR